MKHRPIIVGSLVLAMATSAFAGPFSNPRLDAAYDGLSAAAANLALAQSQCQQNNDFANAYAMAAILAMAQYTLGQLNQNVDMLNASSIPDSLITAIDAQTSRADYYATSDTASPWQTQPPPDPAQDAANGQAQFNDAMGEVGGEGGDGNSGGNTGGGNTGGDDGGAGDGGGGGGGGGGGDPGWDDDLEY